MWWPFNSSNSNSNSSHTSNNETSCPYNHSNISNNGNYLNDKTTSSIPKSNNSNDNWVYPSQSQFYEAMKRKGHSANLSDMKTIVPIHNAVNEKAWSEIKQWESESNCNIFLLSFKGRPQDRSPKAWFKTALGYSPPFDRHDWIIDRCGEKVRYVIDFYSGTSSNPASPSFYLDVRPALDNWSNVQFRLLHAFNSVLQ